MPKKGIVTYAFVLFMTLCLNNFFWGCSKNDNKADTGQAHFFKVAGPCNFKFPADHGAHPGYRTEWWYYTGNVFDAAGKPYGFQLTFFRSQIQSNRDRKTGPVSGSKWRTAQLYFAHAAVSDIGGKRFLHDDIMSRGAVGLAGVEMKDETVNIFLKNWSAKIEPDRHQLTSTCDNFSYEIKLIPEKEIVAHGDKGYSQKGRKPEQASCYYSFTRLQAHGRMTIKDESFTVNGYAWMDHEYSSEALEDTAIGWDWFSFQLDDQTELMLFFIREKDGGISPASGGTHINAGGQITRLMKKDILIKVTDHWKSPSSNALYPSQWEIDIPILALKAVVRSNLADQELNSSQSTGVIYWEGSISVKGEKNHNAVSGNGYAELTGYAVPFRSPL